MKNNEILEDINNIANNNPIIDFLVERFQSSNYRSMHIFQHNRYTEKEFYTMIEIIKNTFKGINKEWIEIPKGDENNGKNNGFFLGNYPDYEKIINKIKLCTNKGTANTLKKNFFPDWERSGVIIRKNEKNRIFFKLTNLYVDNSKEYWQQKEFYKQHINNLLPSNFIDDIYYILKDMKHITYNEFLLFFTFINKINEMTNFLIKFEQNNKSNVEIIMYLIENWRKFNRLKQEAIIRKLSEYMDPSKYKNISKNFKKDWGNFNNETQQIFQSLKEAKIFSIEKNHKEEFEICYSVETKKELEQFKAKRNKRVYHDYHKYNSTSKKYGFEMDHIVKFSLISKPQDIPYIDNKLNLLYINATAHAQKTQNQNVHMKLSYDANKKSLILYDIYDKKDPIYLEINNHVLIKKENIDEYEKHNKILIDKFLN